MKKTIKLVFDRLHPRAPGGVVGAGCENPFGQARIVAVDFPGEETAGEEAAQPAA